MANISPGDRVKAVSGKDAYEGLLIPSLDKEVIMLKLDNGYNIGLRKSTTKLTKLKGGSELETFPSLKGGKHRGLPNVALISTGGTITSRVDYKTGAVRSLSKQSELLANVPELTKLANLKLLNPFNVMSEDMTHVEWQELAKTVATQLNAGAQGAIVTHGTDTLHYTAAVLSFMLENLNKPVAVVGGQRSSDRGSFDGAQNLVCATHYALSNIAEVSVVMHGTEQDNYCIAIPGTKVRKMHTSRRDTFRPINMLPFAKIWPNGKLELISKHFKKRKAGKVIANTKFEPKVAILYVYPGAKPDVIDYYVDKGYKGIIIAATGLGHVPTLTKNKDNSWIKQVKRAVNNDVFVGVTSQCLYGRTHSEVYSNLRILKEAGAVHLEDMLPETAYAKLCCMLGREKSMKKVRELMLHNFHNEISGSIPPTSFLY